MTFFRAAISRTFPPYALFSCITVGMGHGIICKVVIDRDTEWVPIASCFGNVTNESFYVDAIFISYFISSNISRAFLVSILRPMANT
jgi:hypothetical protein